MVAGTTTAILLGLGAAGAGAAFSRSMTRTPSLPEPQPLPESPSVEDATGKAAEVIRKKRAAATQTVYTSPLGVAGEAQVARKTLLGV